jgi:asparagine synthase (glutamine-hydrolysing)
MCGIAGVLFRHGCVEEGALRRMGAALAHRGPDDFGVRTVGPCGLLQTRLAIIDLKGGHQPMIDGARTLVANGEIYNFVELRAKLEARGRVFATRSDSETILHSLALDGVDALRSLEGMFAFALYDQRSGELLLARDRLGIKPLCYARLPDRLLFASELKALLAAWPDEIEVDAGALLQYLQNRFNTGETALVRGIYRVPPGTALIVDAELRVRQHRYWSPLGMREQARSFERATAEFEPLFGEVMQQHLRADVPYGVLLSGGVDSSTILAMATELTGRPVRTFSIGYRDTASRGELADAAVVARRFGATHTEVVIDGEAAVRRVPHTVWATDDLLHDYSCLATSFLAERAAEDVKVVLTGEGGDEVFAGYGRYRRPLLQRWLGSLVAPDSGGFRTRGYWRRRWAHRVFGPELKAAAAARRQPFIEAWQATPRVWNDLMRCQYTDLVTYLPDDLLVKGDRVLMAFGLEGRVPFLDHRVVEFGFTLPKALKVRRREGKLFLKRWAERRLAHEQIWRRKRGFYVPIGWWLRGKLLDGLAVSLPRHPAIRHWFQPTGVGELIREQQHGGNASRAIWGLMQFAIWHRIFVEHHVPGRNEDPLEWIA